MNPVIFGVQLYTNVKKKKKEEEETGKIKEWSQLFILVCDKFL